MKVLVLNGSPKGDNSVTMSYMKYLMKIYPEHQFTVKHIAQSLKKIELNPSELQAILEEARNSDGILWAFPLYFLLVHSNYKRFIELLFEREAQETFKGKYVASFSTSIHFYDHTAHNYIRGICEDLDARFAGSFSAGMNDLVKEEGQKQFRLFADEFFQSIKEQRSTAKTTPRYTGSRLDYQPGDSLNKLSCAPMKVAVIAESIDPETNLGRMVNQFKNCFTHEITVVDLSKAKIKGPCMGCMNCGFRNECVYDGKDELRDIYENIIHASDIVVYAAAIRDRYFSARWKNFVDRRFFQTHQPGSAGKQIGYLVSGPLLYDGNLRQIIEGGVEIDQGNLVDIVSDEWQTSFELDEQIASLAHRLVINAQAGAMKPRTFLSVGGAKIFRDEMWGGLRFVFPADYQYYKKHGMLDFPQKEIKTRLLHLALPIMNLNPIRRQIQKRTKDMMHRPLDKVIEKVQKEKQLANKEASRRK